MVSLKINYFFTVNYCVLCAFFQVQRPRHPRRDRRALHGQGQGHRGPRRRSRDTAFRVRYFVKLEKHDADHFCILRSIYLVLDSQNFQHF